MKTPLPTRETVEQLAEEFAERYRRGERPPLSEYTARPIPSTPTKSATCFLPW